ncbi:DUF3263 domain-containing protein [Arcanobacterium hippocoleae]
MGNREKAELEAEIELEAQMELEAQPEPANRKIPQASQTNSAQNELPDLQEKILEIERGWWKIAPTRADAIAKVLGFSEARYYLILGVLLDSPEFWKLDPPLAGRLKNLRDNRLEERQIRSENEN